MRLPARQVADMLYSLALANRTVYTRDIVQRLGPAHEGVVSASEQYLDAKGLPLPAQMFSLAAEEIDNDGYWLSLRSLDPINFANGPLTPVEEEGLQYVQTNPDKAFYAEDDSGAQPSIVGSLRRHRQCRCVRGVSQQPSAVAAPGLQAGRRDGGRGGTGLLAGVGKQSGRQGPVLARVVRERGFDNVGLLYVDDAWGRGLAGAFEAAGAGAMRWVAVARDQAGFLTEFRTSAGAGAKALVVIAPARMAGALVRESIENPRRIAGRVERRSEKSAKRSGTRRRTRHRRPRFDESDEASGETGPGGAKPEQLTKSGHPR